MRVHLTLKVQVGIVTVATLVMETDQAFLPFDGAQVVLTRYHPILRARDFQAKVEVGYRPEQPNAANLVLSLPAERGFSYMIVEHLTKQEGWHDAKYPAAVAS